MLCKVCKDGLESMGKAKRLCSVEKHVANTQKICYYLHEPGSMAINQQSFPADFRYLYGHHRNENSFARSARQGCVMCNDFPFYDDQGDQSEKVRAFGFFTVFWVSYEYDNPCMTVDSGYGSKTIALAPAQTTPILDGALNFNLGYSTNSTQTWPVVSSWMETCLRHHARCKEKIEGNGYKPTRLLEIRYPQTAQRRNPPTLRLVSGDQCPPESSYATLSHRWGNKPVENTLRLLKSTSAWLEELNPISDLPNTFRDAMCIANHFGIQYLWIDRLCIYQDTPEDWRREAGTMRDVYRNSLFCISALGAEDDEGGCFFSRDPSVVAPTAINLNQMGKYFRADLEDTAWCTSFQSEPLIRRAWVLQERLILSIMEVNRFSGSVVNYTRAKHTQKGSGNSPLRLICLVQKHAVKMVAILYGSN